MTPPPIALLINASYHDYKKYLWFMGGDLDYFQDNLQIV